MIYMGYYSYVQIATTQKGFEKIKAGQEKFEDGELMDIAEITNYKKFDKDYVLISWDSIKYYKEYKDIQELEKSLAKIKDGYVFCRLGEENGDIEFRKKSKDPALMEQFEFVKDIRNKLNKEFKDEEEEEFE